VNDDFPDPRLAERLTRAARAAQTLSETLWEALLQELADPRPERVAELSVKLGEVAAVVASLARVDVRAREPEESVRPRTMDTSVHRTSGVRAFDAPTEREARVEDPRASRTIYDEPSGPSVERWEPSETDTPPVPAVLIDELAAAESAPRTITPEPPSPREAPPFANAPPVRPGARSRPREGDPPRTARPQIEIRDERSAEGPAAWIDSIGRRLERHEQDGSPFAVLLIELVDIERLHHAEPSGEVPRLTGHMEDAVEDALARELRPADSLTREGPGRYWLLAPQTDAPGAQMLVEQIARAVRSSASHEGVPLEVAVGIAVCPDDGRRASELAAHADVGLYAARATGRSSGR
jgi:GGDEF domain-containing protein